MSNDPTFQTSGGLLVTVRNETNLTYASPWQGMHVTPNAPEYLPVDSPPPAWVEKRDYFAKPGQAYTFGTITPNPPWNPAQGAYQVVRIADMSAQAVRTDKAYFFTVDTPVTPGPEHSVRVAWTISGVAGGSTLLPAFGLYNLVEPRNPNAWSYISPPSFTGKFAIELVNPAYSEVVTLSVAYVPCRDMYGGYKAARLNFRIGGSRLEVGAPGTDDQQQPAEQEILTPTAMYEVTNGPGSARPGTNPPVATGAYEPSQ